MFATISGGDFKGLWGVIVRPRRTARPAALYNKPLGEVFKAKPWYVIAINGDPDDVVAVPAACLTVYGLGRLVGLRDATQRHIGHGACLSCDEPIYYPAFKFTGALECHLCGYVWDTREV